MQPFFKPIDFRFQADDRSAHVEEKLQGGCDERQDRQRRERLAGPSQAHAVQRVAVRMRRPGRPTTAARDWNSRGRRALSSPAARCSSTPMPRMIARTTDDYQAMARAGVVAVIEPAFWLGQPRTNVGSYVDYLSTIIGFEKFRAGQFGVRHYCCVGRNPKEANNEALAEAVMEILPRTSPPRKAFLRSVSSATTSRPRSRTSISGRRSSSPRRSSCRS